MKVIIIRPVIYQILSIYTKNNKTFHRLFRQVFRLPIFRNRTVWRICLASRTLPNTLVTDTEKKFPRMFTRIHIRLLPTIKAYMSLGPTSIPFRGITTLQVFSVLIPTDIFSSASIRI